MTAQDRLKIWAEGYDKGLLVGYQQIIYAVKHSTDLNHLLEHLEFMHAGLQKKIYVADNSSCKEE